MFIEGTCEYCFIGFLSPFLFADVKALYHALCLLALASMLACSKSYVYTYTHNNDQ